MSVFPAVMVAARNDEAGRFGAWVRSVVTSHGYRLTDVAATADVVVTDGELPSGCPALVLVGTDWSASAIDRAAAAGIGPDSAAPDAAVTAVPLDGPDLLARVDPSSVTAVGTLTIDEPARVLLRSAGRPVAACAADARTVALAVRPDTGPSTDELLFNAITLAAGRPNSTTGTRGSRLAQEPAWLRLKAAVTDLQALQAADGSVPDVDAHAAARISVGIVIDAIVELSPRFPHDTDYLAALVKDFTRWADGGFAEPDFLDSLVAFHPERERVDGREHLVLFPMYTQNGSPDRHIEAVLVQVIWPDFVADLEAGDYANKLFVPIRFLDFTSGYDTNSAVLFPETVAMREVPKFTWGAIFADREAARFRWVVAAAAEITGLALPPDAARLLADQQLTEETFVMWDLIHDRTHMHGDLPFDPFMIKQRMPYFLYSLEELRCDLTAFRESVALERQGVPHARLVQYAILFDRIFRFPITGSRVRNYDGLGGQLLFAWLHRHGVLHWTDNRLSIEWDRVADRVLELGRRIEDLYWRSIDRPKVNHWLAAYALVSETLEPHAASLWARGAAALPVDGPPKGLTDAVLPDEFPLSMFYEALSRKLSPVIASTKGITG
jgi:hypothetical protein